MPFVISANRLSDGVVVYARADGAWSGHLAEAQVFAGKSEAQTALEGAQRDVKRNIILEPAMVEVAQEAKGLRALTLREAIRSEGPTIDYGPPAHAFHYDVSPQPERFPPDNLSQKRELIGSAEPR